MTDGKIAGELDVQINSFRNILLNDQHALGMATSQLRVLRNLETEDADKVAEVEREIQVLRVNIVVNKGHTGKFETCEMGIRLQNKH